MTRWLLLSFILPLALAGCSEDQDGQAPLTENGEPPGNVTTDQAWTFYLIWPDPCPADNIGNTSFEPQDTPGSRRECGPGLAGHIPEEQACGTFKVHDPAFQILAGDNLTAYSAVTSGPGFVERRHVWRDDSGTLAEARSGQGFITIRGEGGADMGRTIAHRNSQGQIWFEVWDDGGRCEGVWEGATFEVEQQGRSTTSGERDA